MELNQKEREFVDKVIKMGKSYRMNNRSLFGPVSISSTGEKIIFEYFKNEGEKNGFLIEFQDEDNGFPFKMVWHDLIRGKASKKRVITDIELLLDWTFSIRQEPILNGFNRLLLTSPNIPLRVYICNVRYNVNELITFFDEAVQSCNAVKVGDSFICLIGARYSEGVDFVVRKIVKK